MKAVNAPDSIDVEAVRVGMFVHLDGGWMSHPFPLSSFKVTSTEQIATIRSLGLKRVRWSPTQSDVLGGSGRIHGALRPVPARQIAAAPLGEETPARAEHRRRLAEENAALGLCERQFAEAVHECRNLTDLVPQKPQEARAQAEALTEALCDKMLGAEDISIRLLTDVAGDKASMHALNVAIISLLMGRSFGLPGEDMRDLGVGAMLHDIGKLDLPERVRHREEHFAGPELRLYEEHVAQGVTQGRRMGLSPGAMLVIAQHHEHADGSGFPLRITTDRMTTAARVVALVNRYDNLCNPHLPGQGLTPHESLSMLFAHGKNKFDTAILGAFIKMMGVYPPGSTVQLTDDRYAIVTAVNSNRPLKPRVLVYEPGVPREEALLLDLETTPGLGIRRSMHPARLPRAAVEYLSPRSRVAYFFEESNRGDLALL